MDAATYEKRSREGPCFVCEVLAGNPEYVPYQEQQFAAFSWERGFVDLPDDEMADLARKIGARVERLAQAE